MTNSILNSVKKSVGYVESYTVFDDELMMHINAAFATLYQLGCGPIDGFYLETADQEWSEFLEHDKILLGMVKQYIFQKVKLAHDPPATSFAINAIEEQIKQHEWRITVQAGETLWQM